MIRFLIECGDKGSGIESNTEVRNAEQIQVPLIVLEKIEKESLLRGGDEKLVNFCRE